MAVEAMFILQMLYPQYHRTGGWVGPRDRLMLWISESSTVSPALNVTLYILEVPPSEFPLHCTINYIQTQTAAHSHTPETEWPQHEADHSFPSSAEAKNECTFLSMPPCTIMACTGTTAPLYLTIQPLKYLKSQ